MHAGLLMRSLVGAVALLIAATLIGLALTAGATSDASPWSQMIAWVMAQQRAFHEILRASLQDMSAGGGIAAGLGLIVASALYGVFHAAGPGHGKVVLSTYLLTNRDKLARGVGMAVASAFMQGLVAIVLVYGLIYVAGWIPRETSAAVDWSERISYALVAGIGAYLIWRAVNGVMSFMRVDEKSPVGHHHDHGHDHAHEHRHDHTHHHHEAHDHVHDENCGCGHAHGPSVDQIEQAGDWRSAIGVVFSIGLRPCSGAVLVLVFARALGMPVAGVLAVAAMSAGTALTVTLLAGLAVHTREWVVGLTGGEGRWLLAANGLIFAGGGLLLAVGLSLVAATFAPQHPLGL